MKRYKPGSYYLRLWEGHREGGVQPFRLAHRKSHGVVIVDARGRVHSALCLRGNSKQRRQQMRAALAYLNAPIVLTYQGDPRQLLPYQRQLLDQEKFGSRRDQLIHTGAGGTVGDFPAIDGTVFKLRE